jgi:hypothetical protein
VAKDIQLDKLQYLLAKVNWLVKDVEAWDSSCEWWVSPKFNAMSDRACVNRISKRPVHRYGTDGYV